MTLAKTLNNRSTRVNVYTDIMIVVSVKGQQYLLLIFKIFMYISAYRGKGGILKSAILCERTLWRDKPNVSLIRILYDSNNADNAANIFLFLRRM